jgi:predicted DNA-binding transcriptional regulator AlpA
MSVHRPDDPLLGVEDVARWLGKSPKWIRANYPKYFPEVTRVGRCLSWRTSVIAAYLEKQTAGKYDVR